MASTTRHRVCGISSAAPALNVKTFFVGHSTGVVTGLVKLLEINMAKTKIRTALLSATVASLCCQSAWADDKFDFHGYFRAGTGSNSEGGDQVCFKLPGAKSKYRYGNECETYGEIIFGYQAYRGDDGAYFDIKSNLAYVVEGEDDFEGVGVGPRWREIYAEGGNLVGGVFEGAKFWIGKRFYRRHDVHITDFFYWDMSSAGGGVEDVDLGFGKFAYAYLRNTDDEFDSSGHKIADVNDRSVSRHDFRVYGIDVNPGGQLTVGGDLRFSDESRDGFDGEDGFMLTAEHTQNDLWGGFNKVALQYGKGSASTLAAASDDTNKDGRTWRVVEQLLVEPGSGWSGMGTFVYEDRQDTGDDGTWISLGGRFKYYLNTYLNLVLDAGFDQFEPDASGEDTRELWKVTPSIQLSAGDKFWSRPALRLFATYANWNDAAQDAGLGDSLGGVFGTDTEGWTVGVQAETWW
jgi:maltoporin